MSLESDVRRAVRAKEWLSNPMYDEAWEALRMAYLKALEDLPLADEKGRQEIHHGLAAMKKVKSYIARAVEDGKIAAADLQRQSVMSKVKQMVGR